MPPARTTARPRATNNENDENAGTIRLTRAKAAAVGGPIESGIDEAKKPLGSKRSQSTLSNGAAPTRKRAALGDVSNVAKNDTQKTTSQKSDGKEKDVKKSTMGKTTTGLVSKAAAPTKIQKPSRANSTRSILGTKDKSAAAAELKRPASGSGAAGHTAKKRNTVSTSTTEDEDISQSANESVAPTKIGKVDVNETKTSKTSTTTKTTKTVKQEARVESVDEYFSVPENDEEVRDLDAEDAEDPLMVAEYVHEIFDYLQELEVQNMPNPNYIDSQEELEWKMRGILVDWLLEVHTRFRLLPETLFLAVNIIDRFLSRKVVQLDRLQLVGVTALFIASKYEEVLSPHVQNFRHVADDGFTEAEILSAERFVLAALNYDLSYPNPMNFLRRISKADQYDIQTRTLGKYLLEIACLDHRFLAYPGSRVAAAAMYTARLVLDRGDWDATLAAYAGYTEEEIQPVFKLMVHYLKSPVAHDAFFRKYASKKFLKGISSISSQAHDHCHDSLTLSKASIVVRSWAKTNYPLYLGNDPEFRDAPLATKG
ncbi:A/B/D/E cyclin [Viridothelium virens]|uniref:A/B/D/E cyclin n=1 Tax=Viridothelium virens TaxID=1048519 RepID=A0A6A6HAV7_VIRVR|nr:A/B/D/E cyclin [Viridothelium virens]